MNGGARSPRARTAVAIGATLLAAAWLAMLVGGTGPLDRAIYEWLYAGDRPALAAAARFVTFFGEPTVLVGAGFLFVAIMWARGHLHTGLTLLAVTLVGRGIAEVQKYEVARVRPSLEPHLIMVKTSSFPSGHATSSMIFYLTLALVLTHRSRWRRMAAAFAVFASLLIGTTRVMLGVHWPSDVVGGWTFGLLWVLLTLRIAEHLIDGDSRRVPDRL